MKNLINNFSEKYNIETRLVRNYLDCIEMGDNDGVDMYQTLIINESTKTLSKNIEDELKELTKTYFTRL